MNPSRLVHSEAKIKVIGSLKEGKNPPLDRNKIRISWKACKKKRPKKETDGLDPEADR
jgi:hypothetical protein